MKLSPGTWKPWVIHSLLSLIDNSTKQQLNQIINFPICSNNWFHCSVPITGTLPWNLRSSLIEPFRLSGYQLASLDFKFSTKVWSNLKLIAWFQNSSSLSRISDAKAGLTKEGSETFQVVTKRGVQQLRVKTNLHRLRKSRRETWDWQGGWSRCAEWEEHRWISMELQIGKLDEKRG